jgi:hypothetical protein
MPPSGEEARIGRRSRWYRLCARLAVLAAPAAPSPVKGLALSVHFSNRERVSNAANCFRFFPCPRTRRTATGRASSRPHRRETRKRRCGTGAGTPGAPVARAKALFGLGGATAGRRLASSSLTPAAIAPRDSAGADLSPNHRSRFGETEAQRSLGRREGRVANRRSVWSASVKPRGAHHATFPPDLVEPCIRASTSEKGACPRCGAPGGGW